MKFLPELENNRKLNDLLSQRRAEFVFYCLILSIIYYLDAEFFTVTAFAVSILFWARKKAWLLALVNGLIILVPKIFGTRRFLWGDTIQNSSAASYMPLVCISITLIIIYFWTRYSTKSKIWTPILLCAGINFLLLSSYTEITPFFKILLNEMAFFLSKNFILLAYMVSELGGLNTKDFLLQFFSRLFFWVAISIKHMPLPNSIKSFQDIYSLNTLRLKGLKLLVCAVLLNIIKKAIEYLSYDFFHLINFHKILFPDYLASPSPWWLNLFSLYSHFFLFLAEQFMICFYVVGVARVCGFYFFRPVYKPLQSTGLYDFFRRSAYYYSEFIGHFFFWPILGKSSFLKSNFMRVFFSTAIAIFIGGLILHLKNLIFLSDNQMSYLKVLQVVIFAVAPYYLIAGICIGFSFARATSVNIKNLSRESSILFRGCRIFLIIFFYANLRCLIENFQSLSLVTFSDRLRFIESLLPRL